MCVLTWVPRFDDDQSGTIEYDEFLRHIFPEEYVKAAQTARRSMMQQRNTCLGLVVESNPLLRHASTKMRKNHWN